MRSSTIVIGLLGGVALAAALAAPLYVGLPSRYLSDWQYMTPQGSMYGFMGALLVAVGTGFLAAMMDREEPVRSGTSAGLIAAVVASITMVLPTASLEACSDILNIAGLAGDDQLKQVLAGSLVAAAWVPALAALGMLGAGPAFGAVGGVTFDLWMGEPGGTRRDVAWSVVPMVGLVAGVVWMGLAMLGSAWSLVVLQKFEFSGSYLDQVKLSGTPTIGLVVASGFVVWAARDAVLLYRAGRRLRGVSWGSAAVGMATLMLVEIGVLFPAALVAPGIWLAVAVGGLATIITLVITFRAEEYLDTQPRALGALVSEALLGSVAVIGQAAMVGGSAAIAVRAIALPEINVFLSGAEAPLTVPETLVAGVYTAHFGLGGALLLGAVGWLAFSVPFWLFSRAVAQRR